MTTSHCHSDLLRALSPKDPTERSRVLGGAREALSVILQMGNVELILSSLGGAVAQAQVQQVRGQHELPVWLVAAHT